MESVKGFLEKKLKPKVNPKKSKVERAFQVKFLGISFYKRHGGAFIRVANQSLARFRKKLRGLTKRSRSDKLEEVIGTINRYLMGWMAYYRLADTPSVFEGLDRWIRRRRRQMIWKCWKRGRTRYRELVKLGVPRGRAALVAVGKSPWHMSKTPVINEALIFADMRCSGLKSLKTLYQELCFA